jgi:hypothetical protein
MRATAGLSMLDNDYIQVFEKLHEDLQLSSLVQVFDLMWGEKSQTHSSLLVFLCLTVG